MPAKSGKKIGRKKPSGQQQGQKPGSPGFWVRIKNFLFGGGAKQEKKVDFPPMKKLKGDYWKPSKDESDTPPL